MEWTVEQYGAQGNVVVPRPPAASPGGETPVPAAGTPEPPETETPAGPEGDDLPPEGGGDAAPDEDDEPITVAEHQRQRPRRDRSAEGRIRELNTRLGEAQRQLDYERQQRDVLVQRMLAQTSPPQQATQETTPTPTLPPTPRQDDFETQEAYLEARMAWMMEQGISKAMERLEQQQEARRQSEATRTLQERMAARFVAGRSQYPDFDQAIHHPQNTMNREIIPVLNQFVAEHEQGHVVMYTLATDATLRDELNDRSPEGARRFLAKLATGAVPQASTREAPARRPVAPVAPLRPVNGQGGLRPTDPASIARSEGDLMDYMKARGEYRP